MDPQELLTAPASTLTRKQRKERAALKRQMSAMLPAGYAVGRVRVPAQLPGAEVIVDDSPRPRDASGPISRALELGKLSPNSGHVMVRMLDQQPSYAVGRPEGT